MNEFETEARARKVDAIKQAWLAAGGTANMLDDLVAAASFYRAPGSLLEHEREARVVLRLLLETAGALTARGKIWREASSETWSLAVAACRVDEPPTNGKVKP